MFAEENTKNASGAFTHNWHMQMEENAKIEIEFSDDDADSANRFDCEDGNQILRQDSGERVSFESLPLLPHSLLPVFLLHHSYLLSARKTASILDKNNQNHE